MSALTAVRQTGAAWFVPVTFIVSTLLALSGLGDRTHYFVADLAAATVNTVYIVAPVTATFVAFRAEGFARAVASLGPVRTVLHVVLHVWWPLLLGVPVAFALGVLAALRLLPADSMGWSMLAVYVATVTAAGGFGFVLGQALPSVVALPVAFVASYVWTSFPTATGNLTLHQVDGTFTGCCSTDTVPTWLTVVASGVLLLVALVGFATVAHAAGRGLGVFAAAGIPTVLALALGAGAAVAQSSSDELDLMPVTDRTTPQVCRQDTHVRVCVWPESRDRIRLALEEASRLRSAMTAAGLPDVDRFSESYDPLNQVPITLAAYLSDAEARDQMASGYAWHVHACLTGDPDASPTMAANMAVRLLAGVDRAKVAGSTDSVRSFQRAEAAVRDGTVAELFGPAEAWSRSKCNGA